MRSIVIFAALAKSSRESSHFLIDIECFERDSQRFRYHGKQSSGPRRKEILTSRLLIYTIEVNDEVGLAGKFNIEKLSVRDSSENVGNPRQFVIKESIPSTTFLLLIISSLVALVSEMCSKIRFAALFKCCVILISIISEDIAEKSISLQLDG